MRLNPRTVQIIIGLSIVALVGLVWLQVDLLMKAAGQKEEAFRRSASAALTSIVQQLANDETAHQLTLSGSSNSTTRKMMIAVVGKNKGKKTSTEEIHVEAKQFEKRFADPDGQTNIPLVVEGNRVRYTVERPQRIRLRMFDPQSKADTLLVDTLKAPGTYEAMINTAEGTSHTRVFQFSADSASFILRVAENSSSGPMWRGFPARDREDAVRRAFDKLVLVEGLPIETRLTKEKIDSVSRFALQEAGIGIPFEFGVLSATDSVKIAKSSGYDDQLRHSEFRTRLFPGDVFADANDLALVFPTRKSFLWKQIAPMIAATCIFLLMIVVGFGFTVRTIVIQKRTAAHIVDFINNMTHEFKTPISTIALAAEAIARPEVLSNSEKTSRYCAVIQDENARMRRQVEKILQMAVLEEGNAELELAPVDAHELIRAAVANIALQVESKQGTITTSLDAERHTINADGIHFANIMHNLLDNAIKYSPNRPTITVVTQNVGDRLRVRVSDNGIGMSPEDASRAFDKYFRVSTGNQHDVKGFGLGLSYVKLMVEAHQGTVQIESAKDRGTTVDIQFPATA